MNRHPPYQPSAHPQRLLAELQWLTDSPDLLLPPRGLRLPFRPAMSNSPMPLDNSCYQPRWRLGEHFENIVYFYLKNNTYITDIKRNIQIKGDQRTLGEFDFLFLFDRQWVHLEVALKLYLLDGNGNGLADYIGTRRDDRLADKWHRLINHQLNLSQLPEAKEQLHLLGIDQPPQRSLWLKGWLFYHLSSPLPCVQPPEINPEHLKGWWLTQAELELLEEPGVAFMLVRKPDWLLPASMLETAPLTLEQLRATLSGEEGAHLVLVVSQSENGWVERSRGFVVADSWSARRRAQR